MQLKEENYIYNEINNMREARHPVRARGKVRYNTPSPVSTQGETE